MAATRKPKNTLLFSNPSSWWGSRWREGLPLGNGVIGASVYGGAGEDTVMITHGDLWWQGKDSVLQDVSDKLKDVRGKLDNDDFIGAERILSNELIRKGFRPQPSYPLPLCDFKISMKLDRTAKDYVRSLDMETAEASVSFKDGATRFERNCFVSRVRDLIVFEISRVGQKNIDAEFRFEPHDKFNARTPVAISATPDNVSFKTESFWLCYSARSSSGADFGAVAKINFFAGKQEVIGDSIRITGAEKISVIIKPFVESQREKAWKDARAYIQEIKQMSYDKLLKEHVALHQKLFASADLDLGADGREEHIDEAIERSVQTGDVDPAVIEKLWSFGRYLMITGSRPDARPFAPYGLWCGDYKAVEAQINAAGDLQAVYDMTQVGGLNDFAESVFRLYETALPALRYNATRLYGCRGIFVPYMTSPSTGYPGEVYESIVHFTGVAGWLGNLFYDYSLFTDDKEFLKKRALPFMKEAAAFYEEFFKLDAELKYYQSSPSYSPFTTPGNLVGSGEEHAIARNAAVDFAVARSLLRNLVEGSKASALYKSELPKWEDMLKKIPPYKINSDGTVSEFIDDKCTDNPSAPSLAMFYTIYPDYRGRDNIELMKAFANTARKKCSTARSNMTAAALARYAQVFARLGDGDQVYDMLAALVRGMAMNNLVFACDDWRGMGSGRLATWAQPVPYVNTIVTGAIQECLVQSTPDTVTLLPALFAGAEKGAVFGFKTRAQVEIVSLEWDKPRGMLSVKLKGKRATTIDVQFPKTAKAPKKVDAEKFDDTRGLLMGLKVPANKIVAIDVRI